MQIGIDISMFLYKSLCKEMLATGPIAASNAAHHDTEAFPFKGWRHGVVSRFSMLFLPVHWLVPSKV